MAYNSANRSERLLQNRRFTTDALSLSQEAFTSVLDINAAEVYTQANYIPTASAVLPFSGSSQNGLIVSASVAVPGTSPDLAIMKYWYRKKLKPAADATQQVYYFTTADPSSPTNTVTSDQLVETDQQTSFVSPKYIIAANSSFNTEANPPGYKVVVYKSTSSTAGGISEAAADPATYVFDYKTGVLAWVTGYAPTNTQYVYLSTYQYVGESLTGRLTAISASIAAVSGAAASAAAGGSTGEIQYNNGGVLGGVPTLTYVGGTLKATGSFSGSFIGDGSGLSGIATTLYVTSSAGNISVNLASQALTIQGTVNEVEVSGSGQTITIGLPDNVTIGNSLTVTGDLTVNGTTTTLNVANVNIEDQFILLASGSTSTIDGGIIVQNSANAGEALYWENNPATTGRWALSSSVSPTATSVTAAEYIVSAKTAAGAPAGSPTYGGTSTGYGNIYVDSSTGDVYIYS